MKSARTRQEYLRKKAEQKRFLETINSPINLAIEQSEVRRNGGIRVTARNTFTRPLSRLERAANYRSNSKGYARNYDPNLSEGRTH